MDSTSLHPFARMLRTVMEIKGIHGKTLASQAGLTNKYLSTIRMGRYVPSPLTAAKLVRALGLPVPIIGLYLPALQGSDAYPIGDHERAIFRAIDGLYAAQDYLLETLREYATDGQHER